jgi:NADH-quinone oxidoreductase subunit M
LDGEFVISTHWILTAVIFLPLLGALQLVLAGGEDVRRLRMSALLWSLAVWLLVIAATVLFARTTPPSADGTPQFALVHSASWFGESSRVDIRYAVGVDGISITLLLLTGLLTPLAIWASFSAITTRAKEYYALMLVLEAGMLGVFCALDLLLFYVFFEFTLIPLFFLIGIWGGAEKARAAMKFFIFTVAGSVLTFAAVLYLAYYQYTHSTAAEPVFTLSIPQLTAFATASGIPAGVQWWLFLALAAGFAVKVPLFPVHTWLPLAHTEAPTAGSVILAGVLLKLGSYGFCRLSVPLLPEASMIFGPAIAVLAIVGIIYGALAAWVQADVKKLVAYSSVSHMGFCLLGLFSLNIAGVTGSVVYMINHGLSTGALFLVVGMIYERYHTREISKLGGLARQMPWLAFFLMVFTLSSIGLPGLNGFIGEFLTLAGAALSARPQDGMAAGPLGYAYAIPAASGILLGAVYMLHMCGRILFGPLTEPPHTPDLSGGLKRDLNGREIGILAPIALVCLLIGVYPKPLMDTLHPAIRANVLAARTLPPGAVPGGEAHASAPANLDDLMEIADPMKDAIVGEPFVTARLQ